MRIVQLSSSPGVGGREIVPAQLAEALRHQGHAVWLCCQPGSLTARLGLAAGLDIHADCPRGELDLAGAWRLSRWLRERRIEIIHAHWSKDLANLLLAGRWAGSIPVILTKHVYSTLSKKDPWHDLLYRKVKRVIAVSRLVAENLRQTTALRPEQIRTLYNGLDLRSWRPGPWTEENLRARLGLGPERKLAGFAGRWNAGKGLHEVLQAFAKVSDDRPEWHLVIVGRAIGAEEAEFAAHWQAASKHFACAAKVHWMDYCSNMPEWMRQLDLFICASRFETFGMVVIEAQASGVPVLGSASGGIPEIITPGVNGDLYAAGDLDDLTQSLRGLMGDSGRRERYAQAGRRNVEERFDLKRTAEQTVALYRQVLEQACPVKVGK